MTEIENLAEQVKALMAEVRCYRPLLTLEQAADYLQVSTKTVRRMVRDRELVYRRVGKQLRFSINDLVPKPSA